MWQVVFKLDNLFCQGIKGTFLGLTELDKMSRMAIIICNFVIKRFINLLIFFWLTLENILFQIWFRTTYVNTDFKGNKRWNNKEK